MPGRQDFSARAVNAVDLPQSEVHVQSTALQDFAGMIEDRHRGVAECLIEPFQGRSLGLGIAIDCESAGIGTVDSRANGDIRRGGIRTWADYLPVEAKRHCHSGSHHRQLYNRAADPRG